ncbi:hypothetical protein F5882DRAFT_178213 [Hyaloscypha sp. PMI_1271]|nr:hypothetical protein F5882DRAFT_178213 [Hyaloscypha sp. PMI_1271]
MQVRVFPPLFLPILLWLLDLSVFHFLFPLFSSVLLTCSCQEQACSFHSTSLLIVRACLQRGLCRVRLDAGRHCWRKASTSISESEKRERASRPER